MQEHMCPPSMRPGLPNPATTYAKGAVSELKMRQAYRLSPRVRKAPFPATDKRGKAYGKSKMYMKD